jgi:hypothetical protein
MEVAALFLWAGSLRQSNGFFPLAKEGVIDEYGSVTAVFFPHFLQSRLP